MSRKILILFMVLFVFVVAPSAVEAVEVFGGALRNFGMDVDELKGVAGVGVQIATTPYTDKDEDALPVPILVLEYKDFFIDGKTLGYTFHKMEDQKLEFAAVIEPRLQGYDNEDSIRFTGMEDRDATLDGGARASWYTDYFTLDLTVLGDLGSKYEGGEVKGFLSKEFLDGGFTPRLGVKWQSDSLVKYYYGVKNSEISAGRPEYLGDSSTNFVAGFSVAVPIGEKWAVIGDFEYEGFGDEIQDSPLVDADEIFTYTTGVVYRF